MARPAASSVSLLLRSLAAHQEVSAMQLGLGATRAFASSSEALERRYSPNQFSKDKPLDASLLWMRKSPYVEALVWRRDHLEREFAWTRRNTFELTYFIGGITALFYALSLFGMRSADRQSGYPERNVLFHPTNNTFTLPDERDFY